MRACISAPMITLSAPLQGHVRGVIAADLKLDKFSDLAYAQRPGKHGTVIIFDSFGVLIAYPDFARLVASLRGHPSRPQLPEIGEIRTGPVGAVMRGWDGGDNYEGSIRDEDGRDYFFLQKFSQGDEFSGHSLLLAAEDDFVRNVRNLQIRGIIIALIGSGCFVPVVWIFGSRMSGSLKRITAQASGLRTLAPPDGVPVTSLVAEIHELGRIMAGDEIRDRLGASLGNAFGDNLRSGIEPLVEELLRLGELYPRVRERQAGVCAERQPPRLTVEVVVSRRPRTQRFERPVGQLCHGLYQPAPTLRRPARLSLRDRAEALGVDAERRIELAAEILEGDRCGQFDDLRLAVMLLQPGKERVVDALLGDRHALGIVEREALRLGEEGAALPPRHVR